MNLEKLKNSGMSYVMRITRKRYNPFSEEERLRTQMGEFFGVEHRPCIEYREKDLNGREVVLYEACKTRKRDSMQFPEDHRGENADEDNWCFSKCVFPMDVSVFGDNDGLWEKYLQKRPPAGKVRDFLGHPENEKIYMDKYPEIIELVKEQQPLIMTVTA